MEEIELSNDELRNTTCKLDGDPKVGSFCNKNGLLIKTYGWLVQNAIGIILLIHGFKSHARLTYMKMNIKMPNGSEDVVVDNDNYYIYKDSWIEKFNQHGYSVYTLDLQGHGESQSLGNLRGDINCFDDLVGDVIQYMNQIYDEISNDIQMDYEIPNDNQTNDEIPNDNQTNDEISNDIQTNDEIPNDNQTDDESHDIVTTKKKRLPMYIIGHSMGGNIALRILQLLGKEKENTINAENENDYKNLNIILDNYVDINGIGNDMEEYMINSVYDINNSNDFSIENMNNAHFIANSNDCDSEDSCFSAPDTTNAIINDKYEGHYNYLDKLNIKGCASLSGMMRLQAPLDGGNKSFKYLYLPILKFLSLVAPHALISSEPGYKRSEYVTNICKYDKFLNRNGVKFKCISELVKATIILNRNINYLPKNIPLLFVHSIDDCVCNYKGSAMFYDKAKVYRKELYSVEDMNHAITIEPGNEEILNVIIDWIHDLERNDGEEIENEIRDKIENEIRDEIEDEKENEKEMDIGDSMNDDIAEEPEDEHFYKKFIGWIRNLIRDNDDEIKDEVKDEIKDEIENVR
ncbi:hypothetical protein YYE_04917 [Plasmodium vinckei vinckei]|uniref:Serine aminopeptidase S33 domain-containing protein n=1 Tax=Plasmodium vinckei vinckei TaxID=54757 RepID=A0A081I970_PLAVN|nr:hypothetical protein YYE_04917 [Plasmodium vinckei vinckei]